MTISIIANVSANAGLGMNDGSLLFHIKEDMHHFRELTKNQVVVQGRKTFESIVSKLGKPLPQRTNVVLSRNKSLKSQYGEFIFNEVDSILKHCKTLNDEIDKKVFVIGGADLYSIFLPHSDEIILTHVNKHVEEAEVFFPIDQMEELGFIPVEESEEFYSEEYDAYYKFVRYARK